MVLSEKQEFMFRLVKTFRCLKEDQITHLTRLKFKDNLPCGKLLKDLCYKRGYAMRRLQGGYIAMTGAAQNTQLVEAVYVMLSFREYEIVN